LPEDDNNSEHNQRETQASDNEWARTMFTGLPQELTRENPQSKVLAAYCDQLQKEGHDWSLGDVPLRVDGGMARSETLLQMIADYGGRDVMRAPPRSKRPPWALRSWPAS
jgi:sugar (pentulose or hexulose) kinase